jgi:monomeric sarcosine oxidase
VTQKRIVIIGAGVIGLATAYNLLQQGMKQVIILEQATVDHDQGSSHGSSRLLRFEYGGDSLYSEMVRLSQMRWKNLEHQTGKHLYTPTGILTLGHEGDNFMEPGYNLLRDLGHSPERLTRSSCVNFFPQFDTQEYDFISYNRNGGMMHASTCLQTLRDCILDMGGIVLEHHRVISIDHENMQRPIHLRLASGETMVADRVIVATGPWVHRLLGDLDLPVRLTHQYLLYFAQLPEEKYGINVFPSFMADDLYGCPMYPMGKNGERWLKAASHDFGAPANPDEPHYIDERSIKQVVQRLYKLIPALQQSILAHVEAFMYDVSLDEDFILDYLPDDKRIILGTGFSGHAFKFGLLLGELLSNLLWEQTPVVSTTRFQLARFSQWSPPVRAKHSVA